MAIVVDGNLCCHLVSDRLSSLRKRVAATAFDEHVTVVNTDGLAGQPDQSLDVADFRLFGIPKYHHIPAFRRPAPR